MPDPEAKDPNSRAREAVSRALDEDAYVLGVDGALQAVAAHARLRVMDEDTFVERARAAFQAILMESAPRDGLEIDLGDEE
jgi:predicted lipid-binding transport protein (Tim44 family)